MNQMRRIVEVRNGMIGTVACLLFLVAFEGFLVYWSVFRDRFVIPFVFFGGLIFLLIGYGLVVNHGKIAFLATDGNDLVWAIKVRASPVPDMTRIPLNSLCTIEFVLPKRHRFHSSGMAVRNWEVFLVDVHGTRHQIPTDLYPEVYRKKIVAALREAKPEIKVISNGLTTT